MKKNNYNLLVILLSVLFTAIITGLGTYYWQQNVQKKNVLSKTDKQIDQKIKKINYLVIIQMDMVRYYQ